MKKGQTNLIIPLLIFMGFLLLVFAIILIYAKKGETPTVNEITKYNTTTEITLINYTSIKIASWNLQIYGDKKSSNETLVKEYQEIIKNYDLIFLQEIRDSDGSAWNTLCNKEIQEEYTCQLTSREGRTSSKEQIGIIHKKNLVIYIFELEDPNDVWERNPTLVVLEHNNKSTFIYNAHLKPTDVTNELKALYEETKNKPVNTIILGDLNADCDYYNKEKDTSFDNWTWLINTDTTTNPNTDCSYDRIITNNESIIKNPGVLKTPLHLSDHYLINLEVNT